MTQMYKLEFLSSAGLLAEEINYCSDEDGNVQLHQDNRTITISPRQCVDVVSLLQAHLDVLEFIKEK